MNKSYPDFKSWDAVYQVIKEYLDQNPKASQEEFLKQKIIGRHIYYRYRPDNWSWPNQVMIRRTGVKKIRTNSDLPHIRYFRRNLNMGCGQLYPIMQTLGIPLDEAPKDWNDHKEFYISQIQNFLKIEKEKTEDTDKVEEKLLEKVSNTETMKSLIEQNKRSGIIKQGTNNKYFELYEEESQSNYENQATTNAHDVEVEKIRAQVQIEKIRAQVEIAKLIQQSQG